MALGVGSSKTSTIEVMAETEKEVMTLDDEETFGNFYKSISPSVLQESVVVLTEDDLSQIETHMPKSVCGVDEVKLTCYELIFAYPGGPTREKLAVLCQGVDLIV